MRYYDGNIYYNPKAHGLEIVASHELDNEPYSFYILACWKDSEGGLYLGTDSGCSCPIPFENYEGVRDTTGPLTVEQAIEESLSIKSSTYDPSVNVAGFEGYLGAIRATSLEDGIVPEGWGRIGVKTPHLLLGDPGVLLETITELRRLGYTVEPGQET